MSITHDRRDWQARLRALRDLPRAMKQAGLVLLGLFLLAALEAYSAWYAFASAPTTDLWPTPWGEHPRAAILHSALSIGCGLAAFFGSMVVTALKDDDRKTVAQRAWMARLVSLAFLLIPIGYLANAFGYDAAQKRWEIYTASEAYATDRELVSDRMADSRARAEAAYRLTPPAPGSAEFQHWVKAVFLHAIVMLMAGAYVLPARRRGGVRRRKAKAQTRQRPKRGKPQLAVSN